MLEFLQAVELENIKPSNEDWSNFQLGKYTTFFDGKQVDLEDYKLAIISVEEDRSAINNKGCGKAPNKIRKELYELFIHFDMPPLIDLGIIKNGATVKDTQVALEEVLKYLFENKITVIIIGGSQDLTYGQFMAYENSINKLDIVVVDEKIDIKETEVINSSSFLWHILNNETLFLNSCTHIGHQVFYNNPMSIDILESLNHQTLRLGEVRNSIVELEPFIRNADLLSFDMSALKSSECPANAISSPNGFNGEEACQISRFAGFSNKISSFGLYEFNSFYDVNNQGAKQASQILWYFIEGFSGRKDDFPSEHNKNFMKYIVKLDSSNTEITFWKSTFSNRWWMQMPQKDEEIFLPCSYNDYQTALKDELPDKWMRAYSKMGS